MIMAQCEICGKIPGFGNNVSHSKRRTKTMWGVNVHKATVVVSGKRVKGVKACTRCIRSQYKEARTKSRVSV
jgi:large subunit ribosomal protein L28